VACVDAPDQNARPTRSTAAFTVTLPPLETDPFAHIAFLGDVRAPVRREREPRVPAAAVARKPLDPASTEFFATLCRSAGVEAARYRDTILQRRQAACLRALRASSCEEGLATIARDAVATRRALAAVMIGVTAFFRDGAVFASLAEHIAALHAERGPLDVLSAGCSDGSELYSTAMVTATVGAARDARFFWIDCRADAIALARLGVYAAESARAIPEAIRDQFVRPIAVDATRRRERGERFERAPLVRVSDALREACRWQTADVFQPIRAAGWPERFDVVLCRNLAIYLTADATHRLWENLLAHLRPGGLIVIGKAEYPPQAFAAELVKLGPCLFRKGEGMR
jgi:chemotaxis protein methyltransferase CheR